MLEYASKHFKHVLYTPTKLAKLIKSHQNITKKSDKLQINDLSSAPKKSWSKSQILAPR